MIDLKPMQMFGRAVLSTPFRKNWDETLRASTQVTTRGFILKHWRDFPDFVRKDQGFQGLMDYYHPTTEEEYAIKRSLHMETVRQHVHDCLGAIAARKLDKPLHFMTERELEQEVVDVIRAVPIHRAAVDFQVPFGGVTAISTTSTAKTIAGVKPRTNQSVYMWGFNIGFDGTTSTNGPAIVELQQNTWATNAPGTNSTSVTGYPIDNGRPETIQSSVGKTWTTEPTVLTLWETFFIPSYMGSGIVFTPLTKPFVMTGTIGGSMRITQQSGVTANGTGSLKVQE